MKPNIILSNDEIVLINKEGTIAGEYEIYERITNKRIGLITYREYHRFDKYGDIGYIIWAEYRNNNYAYKALKLLTNLLQNNEIESFWITCEKENEISKHIIDKYKKNHELINQFEKEKICYYELETRKKEENYDNSISNKTLCKNANRSNRII